MNDSNKDLLDSFVKPLSCPSCKYIYEESSVPPPFHTSAVHYRLHELFVFKPPYRHYICRLCKVIYFFPELTDKEPSEPYLLKNTTWLLPMVVL